MEEEIFTREEAASYLKVDKGTITQWIRSGRLQAAKINPDKPKAHIAFASQTALRRLSL